MYTVSALYDRIEDAYEVVRALQDAGFRRDDISLISRDADNEYSRYIGSTEPAEETAEGAAAGAGIGAVLGGLGGLLVGLGALAIPGVGPIIAAGPLATTLAGAGIGAAAGGLLGALTGLGIPEEQANVYAEGVRRGGTLVVVRTEDARSDEAVSVLNRFNPVNVQDRASNWRRDDNWSRFDDAAEPYTRSSVVSDSTEGPIDGYTGFAGTSTSGAVGGDQLLSKEIGGSIAGGIKDSVDRDYDHISEPTVMGTMTSGAVGGDQLVNRTEVDEFGAGWMDYEPRYQQHYSQSYGTFGRDFSYYRPAYGLGYRLGRDPRYSGYTWDQFEPEARREWERDHGDTMWDDVRDAVRNAWESITR